MDLLTELLLYYSLFLKLYSKFIRVQISTEMIENMLAFLCSFLINLQFKSIHQYEFEKYRYIFEGEEKYFEYVEKLTSGGDNAEAYFSFDGTKLVFQRSDYEKFMCDQIFIYDLKKKKYFLTSTGKGRTTCGYFMPDNKKIVYSSTHHLSPFCPEVPKLELKRYYWPIFPYDIFLYDLESKKLEALTFNPLYDAEATVNKKGEIVFTSFRDGDIGVYLLDSKTKEVKKVINFYGYEGGPFFMPDNEYIVYRAFYPENEEEFKSYKELLEKKVVAPLRLEIYLAKKDGTEIKKITNFGKISFAPFPHPNGKYIIFSANLDVQKPHNFDLYIIKTDGTNLERITFFDGFDCFPMFSWDGKYLVFSSNRVGEKEKETNIFLAKLSEDFIRKLEE
ncbi:MAG: hypothetical protein ABDH37_07800 [Candidatus Hydrothermales bacterium]